MIHLLRIRLGKTGLRPREKLINLIPYNQKSEMSALKKWQKRALDIILREFNDRANKKRSSVGTIIVGPPGTGKSFALDYIMDEVRITFPTLKIRITATTGAASTRIKNATTLATFLQIGGDAMKLHNLDAIISIIVKKNPDSILNTDVLVIDEVSMLSQRQLENLDAIFKRVRKDPRPYGGIYMILIGDPFQLPPVPHDTGGGVLRNIKEFVESCLESERPGFNYVVANQMMRSSECPILQRVLLQIVSPISSVRNQAIATLREHCYRGEMSVEDVLNHQQDTGATILCCAREDVFSVSHYNAASRQKAKEADDYKEISIQPVTQLHNDKDEAMLDLIGGRDGLRSEVAAMSSRDGWTVEKTLSTNLPYMIRLKINCGDVSVVNGDLGQVITVNDDGSVLFRSYRHKKELVIPRQEFKSEWVTCIGFEGCPLLACSAMTVHKSQGSTLESGIVFEPRRMYSGEYLAHMLYTALSRVKRIKDIRLSSYLLDVLDTPPTQEKLEYVWKLEYMSEYLTPDSVELLS